MTGGRWSVGVVAAVTLVAVGLLYANATLLAAALIPLAYVVYGALSTLPAEPSLAVSRQIEPAAPAPGERVAVTLTVENKSESVLPDVRVVDGVSAELTVEDGSPRLCASLSPGETRTTSYTVVARRGTYAFDRPLVRLRSLAASDRLTDELAVEGDDELLCATAVTTAPKQHRQTRHAGTVTADSAGSGLEFHSTRQYRPGDPLSRIDWHHLAKGGEVTTVQYREERTSRTVLLLDARPVNRVTHSPGYPTAVDRCGYAGERLHELLTSAGVETTVAAVGLDDELATEGVAWADPTRKTLTPQAVFEAVARADGGRQPASPPAVVSPSASVGTDAGGRERPAARADDGDELERVLVRLPSNARVVVCSPLLDGWPVELVRSLAGRRADPLVVSPDPTEGESLGQRLLAVARAHRIDELAPAATVVDWPPGEPLELRETAPMDQLQR